MRWSRRSVWLLHPVIQGKMDAQLFFWSRRLMISAISVHHYFMSAHVDGDYYITWCQYMERRMLSDLGITWCQHMERLRMRCELGIKWCQLMERRMRRDLGITWCQHMERRILSDRDITWCQHMERLMRSDGDITWCQHMERRMRIDQYSTSCLGDEWSDQYVIRKWMYWKEHMMRIGKELIKTRRRQEAGTGLVGSGGSIEVIARWDASGELWEERKEKCEEL